MVWQTEKLPANIDLILAEMAKYNWKSIWIKVMNQTGNERPADVAAVREYLAEFQAAGVTVGAWVYITPGDASDRGACFGDLCTSLGVAHAMVNAEAEFEQADTVTACTSARRWLAGFREHSDPDTYLALSTFAQPDLHLRFPYFEFLDSSIADRCDAFAGQCYGRSPILQIESVCATAASYGVDPIPTLRAYSGDGIEDWARITALLEEAVEYVKDPPPPELPVWTWWHWAGIEDEAALDVLDLTSPAPLPPAP
jgi:hypothetical protein